MAARKKTKEHGCIKKIDKALASRGECLVSAIIVYLSGRPRGIFVATEKIEGKGKPAMLEATYCPFCGEAMPS